MGLRPSSAAFLREVTTRALAPSEMAEALPAVTTPPSFLKTGLRPASASGVVSRGHSSVSTILGSPLRCGMATGDDLVLEPAARGWPPLALSWLR